MTAMITIYNLYTCYYTLSGIHNLSVMESLKFELFYPYVPHNNHIHVYQVFIIVLGLSNYLEKQQFYL